MTDEPQRRKKKTTSPDGAGGTGGTDGAPRKRRRRRRRSKRDDTSAAVSGNGGQSGGRRRGRSSAPSTPLDEGRRIALRRLGIRRLRPEQERALEAVLAGRDTLVVLPTGYGKSLIYQVAALMAERPTVVISPLIALMQDQEAALRSKDVPVVRLDSTLRVRERREGLARIAEGGPLVVLTTPETLESDDARPALQAAEPSLLCVDEAHCISEWGHDFRPAYLRVGAERKALGIPQAIALTATATPRVCEDIAGRLKLNDPVVVTAAPYRSNLILEAHLTGGSAKIERAGRILRRLQRPGIVYCATKRAVDEIYGALVRARIACSRYHGGMKTADREAEQKLFMKTGRRSVMVATSAFGMGIDKPDIRYIMHYQVPASLEQYVQEAGRAGRDGRPSRCILLYDPADLEIQRFLQDKSRPSGAQLKRVARALEIWTAEDRAVTPQELALSAQVTVTTCRSLCAQLEEGGLVEKQGRSGFATLVEPAVLRREAQDLARRFEIERRQDERRLRAISEYAESEECRSVLVRRWFGEEDPPECGHCDMCRERGVVATDGPSRRGRRRKSGAKKKPGGARKPETAATDGAKKTGRRRRRGGRRRRKAAPAE